MPVCRLLRGPGRRGSGADSAGERDRGDPAQCEWHWVWSAVPAGEHRADHGQRFGAAVRTVQSQVQPPVDQPGQVDALRCARTAAGSRPAFGTRLLSWKLTDT